MWAVYALLRMFREPKRERREETTPETESLLPLLKCFRDSLKWKHTADLEVWDSAKLGEQMWQPREKKRGTRAPSVLDYVKHEGVADVSSAFWVSSSDSSSGVIDATGAHRGTKPGLNERFPGLCTNTAPFSTENSQDTSSKWQISLDVNNQTLTG